MIHQANARHEDLRPVRSDAPASHRRGRRAGWLAAAAAASLLVATPVLAQGGANGAGPADGTAPGGQYGPSGQYGQTGPAGQYGPAQRDGTGPMHEAGGMRGATSGAMHGGMHGSRFAPMGSETGPRFGDAAAHRGPVDPAGRGAPGTAAGRRAPVDRAGQRGPADVVPAGRAAGAMLPGLLQRLPIGTTVTVAAYGADPAEGADATNSWTAVVGETSEVAFAQQVEDALSDAAFLTLDVGERTERIELADANPRAPIGFLGRTAGPLELGQTISVAFYASADDATPSTTLTFTFGEDSMAAFQEAVATATAESQVAEVTRPAHSRTLDLSSLPYAAGPRR